MKLDESLREAIDEARAQQYTTRRATVAALEKRLYEPLPCLDHGFVRCIDYMGDDGAIVQAARVSYGKGTKAVRQDRGLLRYLLRHRHTSPFEMCEIKLHCKMPIFVARQWIRHRTASVNEYSARYSVMDREFYLPAPQDLAVQSKSNKQGRGEVLTAEEARAVLALLKRDAETCYASYETLMEDHHLARELARMNLPVNYYTQWYWKVDLHNLMHFLGLRLHPHAQYEIRVFAEAIASLVADWVPFTWEAFQDYKAGGAFFSQQDLRVIRRMLGGETVEQEDSGLSKREWRELTNKLDG